MMKPLARASPPAFDGHGTVQTPLIGGDTAHEHFFGGTGGVEAVIEGPGGAG